MPTDTSLRAYEEIKPELTDRQQRVVDTVRQANHALTTREILDEMGVGPIGWQPRVSELEEAGVLQVAEKRPCTVSEYTGAVKAYEVNR